MKDRRPLTGLSQYLDTVQQNFWTFVAKAQKSTKHQCHQAFIQH